MSSLRSFANDLYSFIQAAFPIVSPGAAFAPNWHIEAIAFAADARASGRDQAPDHHGAATQPQVDLRLGRIPGLRPRP